MIVRCIYLLDDDHEFWVEATEEEAREQVFPYLSPEAIEKSRACEERSRRIIQALKDEIQLYPYCFLVSRDLTSIEPFHASYPFDNQWNAYSPFRKFPETRIESLEELKALG